MLGFGNTIGSGVFTLTGVAAKSAGSAVFIGFIISGLVALLTGLVFAEFAAIIPQAGSSYLYAYTTFGELAAWIVGWNQNLRYGGTSATQSRGWSSYFVKLCATLGLALPKWVDALEVFSGSKGSPLAVAFLLMCTWLQTRGSKAAADFNCLVTSLKLMILTLLAVVSFCHFDSKNFKPFLDEEKGVAGVFEGATILFFGYLGFLLSMASV